VGRLGRDLPHHCAHDRQRERKVIKGTEKDAKQLVQFILRQELAGVNVIAALQGTQSQPEAAPTRPWPPLRQAVPEFIRD
jgi:hypothetical protein